MSFSIGEKSIETYVQAQPGIFNIGRPESSRLLGVQFTHPLQPSKPYWHYIGRGWIRWPSTGPLRSRQPLGWFYAWSLQKLQPGCRDEVDPARLAAFTIGAILTKCIFFYFTSSRLPTFFLSSHIAESPNNDPNNSFRNLTSQNGGFPDILLYMIYHNNLSVKYF